MRALPSRAAISDPAHRGARIPRVWFRLRRVRGTGQVQTTNRSAAPLASLAGVLVWVEVSVVHGAGRGQNRYWATSARSTVTPHPEKEQIDGHTQPHPAHDHPSLARPRQVRRAAVRRETRTPAVLRAA